MLKTPANPHGTPIEAFDAIRGGVSGDRSQFYQDLSEPFYGANRPGNQVSQGLRDSFWLWGMQVGLKGAYDRVKAFSETDLSEDLRRVEVPTLIVHGDDDQIVPIDASARRAVGLVKDATLKVYPGAPARPGPGRPDQGPVQHRPARLPPDLSLQDPHRPASRLPSLCASGGSGGPAVSVCRCRPRTAASAPAPAADRSARAGAVGSGPAMSQAATPGEAARALTRRTAWGRNVPAPLRAFLETEVSGALLLLAAAVAALVWVNSPWGWSYDWVWSTELWLRLDGVGLEHDLRWWVNDGLMALFFLVVGLEVRREFDAGELRDRRRAAVPVLAAVGGMLVPVVIYLLFTSGTDASRRTGLRCSRVSR